MSRKQRTPLGIVDSPAEFQPLPAERLTRLEGWAMRAESMAYVYRPATVDGIRDVLALAQSCGRSVIARGSGYSYGDPSLNAENVVLDVSRMTRVLAWDPATGVIQVEPGVTIGQLWRYVLEDGWWPPVVPGTMYPTLGGCVSTNVHGKNHWHAGSFGEHVLSLELMVPSGEVVTCSRDRDSELFHAVVGSLGLLGVVVSLTLQLQRVGSGLLQVREHVAANLEDMFDIFEQNAGRADHLIGWIDGFETGRSLGRGIVQSAVPVEDDAHAAHTLRPSFQDLPETLLGVIPRSLLWRVMKLGTNDAGMRGLNRARHALASFRPASIRRVPHAQFHFILDYVPHWKWAFWPAGITQYQVFVPAGTARSVFATLLSGSQRCGHVPYLAVFKRHRADPFLLSYSVNGYSLALDYHTTVANEAALHYMLARFTSELVLPAGGRFYPAKDTMLDRESLRQSLSPAAVERFLAIKRRLDPDERLQSDLYRRILS